MTDSNAILTEMNDRSREVFRPWSKGIWIMANPLDPEH